MRAGWAAPPRAGEVAVIALLALMVASHASADALDVNLDRVATGAPWPRQLLLEDARRMAAVDVAWPETPRLGEGATLCVVDTGLDLRHPSFLDAAGQSRVTWLLDLEGPPTGLHPELERGDAVYDAEAIAAELARGGTAAWARDWNGHGTAITAAAVGDDAGLGGLVPGPYAGVAPRASIVVVRALRRGVGGLRDEDLIRGAAFCAATLDPQRGVMLFALGGHDGAHDGSEPLEVALAGWVSRGYVLVAAAGNEGDLAIHAGGTPSGSIEVPLVVPEPEGGEGRVVLAVRTDRPLSVRRPDGSRVIGSSTVVDDGEVRIDARSPRATYVVLSGPAGGTYQLGVEGDFDAWIAEQSLGSGFDRPYFSGPFAHQAETVAIPATHPALIAVGATVSRAAWSSTDGSEGLVIEPEPGGRAPFSARGPAASGWARPDVMAPGALIRTALSSSIETGPEALFTSEAQLARFRRGEGVVLAGTSISAALVAGAIALARAERSDLRPEEERAALMLGGVLSEGLEAPQLDVAQYLAARAAAPGLTVDRERSSLVLSRVAARPGARTVSATVLLRDALGAPIEGPITLRAGSEVLVEGRAHRGLFRALLPPLYGDVGTTVLIEASVAGTPIATRALSLRPDERGHDVTIAGCRLGAPADAPLVLTLMALSILFFRRSARGVRRD